MFITFPSLFLMKRYKFYEYALDNGIVVTLTASSTLRAEFGTRHKSLISNVKKIDGKLAIMAFVTNTYSVV